MGQSVVFCIPEEIKIKILARTSKRDIDVSDVLCWAISDTWVDILRSMPLWATQGQRFERQSEIWAGARTKNGLVISQVQASKFLESESQSLEDRYRPYPTAKSSSFVPFPQHKNNNLIMQHCQEFGHLEFNSATLQEEQERELSPEIEDERQVQKPAPTQAAKHHLDDDVMKFVSTGVPVKGSKAYMPAFEGLRNTSAATNFDLSQFHNDLLITADFACTVDTCSALFISDAFQRPVQWILTSIGEVASTSNTVEYMMIISPFEAHCIMPEVRKSDSVTLHLYSPRINLGHGSLDALDLYTVPERTVTRILPRNLVLQLNLFAGQLYFGSFEEYVEVCGFLNLAWKKAENGCIVAADGFILTDEIRKGISGSVSRFKDSPINFLKALMMKIRRNCEGIDKTHMGKMLNGILLEPSDFIA